tara:strand:- start:8953 stop:9627 length:675 start_codon:yes stop_codon:yes gene_type:complete
MPLEASTYIDGLDASWPLGGDPTNKGDDHHRLVKGILKNQFPGVGGNGFAIAITATEAELNFVSGVTSSIQAQLDAILGTVRESLLPVGSVYTNATVSTNPATLLGFGTWTAFGSGKVLVGVDGTDTLFDTLGETGGTKDAVNVAHTHTASTDTTGAHVHTYAKGDGGDQNMGSGDQSYEEVTTGNTSSAGNHSHVVTIDSAGVTGVNANVQPYITVYMWKRTA